MISFKQYLIEKSKPPGNYASIGVDGGIPINLPKTKSGVATPLDKLHVTLIYSPTTSLNPAKVLQTLESKFPVVVRAVGTEFDVFDGDNGKSALVLRLESPILNAAHQSLVSMGCKHTYPEYNPHVSVVTDINTEECHALAEVLNKTMDRVDLRLSGYTSKPIVEDWKPTNK